ILAVACAIQFWAAASSNTAAPKTHTVDPRTMHFIQRSVSMNALAGMSHSYGIAKENRILIELSAHRVGADGAGQLPQILGRAGILQPFPSLREPVVHIEFLHVRRES